MEYFTLVSQTDSNAPFEIEFGDHDRKTVEQERRDLRDGGHYANKFRIVRSNDDQASIDRAVEALNN